MNRQKRERNPAFVMTSRLERMQKETPEVYTELVNRIRAGAYLHVAAASVGVTPTTLSNWIRRGAKEKGGPYARFFRDAMKATAEASVVAEASLRESNPLLWLQRGPRKLLGDDWGVDAVPGPATSPFSLTTAAQRLPAPVDSAVLAAALTELAAAGVVIEGVKVEAVPTSDGPTTDSFTDDSAIPQELGTISGEAEGAVPALHDLPPTSSPVPYQVVKSWYGPSEVPAQPGAGPVDLHQLVKSYAGGSGDMVRSAVQPRSTSPGPTQVVKSCASNTEASSEEWESQVQQVDGTPTTPPSATPRNMCQPTTHTPTAPDDDGYGGDEDEPGYGGSGPVGSASTPAGSAFTRKRKPVPPKALVNPPVSTPVPSGGLYPYLSRPIETTPPRVRVRKSKG